MNRQGITLDIVCNNIYIDVPMRDNIIKRIVLPVDEVQRILYQLGYESKLK